MKIRTCPHCGYRYSIGEYVKKIVFKIVISEWNCKACNKKITFDFGRRVIVALCFGGLLILLSILLAFLKSHIGMTPLMLMVLIAVFIIGSILIFTFDTFKKVK
jgi:prepilin signal peptidase PulO-like enzyme (type II secretory pathway)